MKLTSKQDSVLSLLLQEKKTLSAYTILERLRHQGFRAPLQVYRVLDKLIELGLVHRLESMNSFIACSYPQFENHTLIAFTICKHCENITEFHNKILNEELNKYMQTIHFQEEGTKLEIRGTCALCQKRQVIS
ncbi:MAG: zinc uptake regulator [Candidatus Tokpelaia sp. JSC161]|jgi:Fur family zinc uptake transcriptional regulator|nr:MAG: zinc uptake regulator [Candidatus Tokpelaia sp. JSC161]